MHKTIKSRKLGRELTYFGHGGYIWVNLNGMAGTLGNQICYGGELRGSTVMYSTAIPSNDLNNFLYEVSRWHRKYIAKTGRVTS